jgi:hypothetical protein
LILRNAFLFGFLAGIGEVFVFMGKAFITVFSIVIMYYAILNTPDMEVSMIFAPLFVICSSFSLFSRLSE